MPVQPLISVVIPTYNRAAWVGGAVESVLSQTYPYVQCVVVDDGSEDDTPRALKSFADRVDVVRTAHQGVAHARNAGLRRARGDYIAFLDSDDRFLPQKLEKQLAYVQEKGVLVSQTGEIWYRGGRRVHPAKRHVPDEGWLFERSLRMVVISSSSAMLHRRVVEQVGFFDEALPVCEDYDYWLRVTARFPVAFLPEGLVVKNGGRPDQLSNLYEVKDAYRIQALRAFVQSDAPAPLRRLAWRELRFKCRVVARGAARRGRFRAALHYTAVPALAMFAGPCRGPTDG